MGCLRTFHILGLASSKHGIACPLDNFVGGGHEHFSVGRSTQPNAANSGVAALPFLTRRNTPFVGAGGVAYGGEL